MSLLSKARLIEIRRALGSGVGVRRLGKGESYLVYDVDTHQLIGMYDTKRAEFLPTSRFQLTCDKIRLAYLRHKK